MRGTEAIVRSYLGLTLDVATAEARAEARTLRTVGVDGTCYLITTDYSAARVDVELRGGVVVAAVTG